MLNVLLRISVISTLMILSTSALAAGPDWRPWPIPVIGDHKAPEPITMIGLALGAGGVAAARWRSKRKSSNKP